MEALYRNGCARVAALLAVMACCLLVGTGCRRGLPASTPVTYPSVVTIQNGKSFYVSGLRIPGTMQELRIKEGDSLTWVPLKQVSVVRFTGPACDGYRPAIISLTNGERLRREVFADFLIEGSTDMGYWNVSLAEVRSLEMGTD